MKTNTQPKTEATGAVLTYQQLSAFILESIQRDFQRLVEIRIHDEHWDDEDVDIDLSVEMALECILRLKGQGLGKDELFAKLCMLGAPIRLAIEQFSRPDSHYWRTMRSVERTIDSLGRLLDSPVLEAA